MQPIEDILTDDDKWLLYIRSNRDGCSIADKTDRLIRSAVMMTTMITMIVTVLANRVEYLLFIGSSG